MKQAVFGNVLVSKAPSGDGNPFHTRDRRADR